MMRLFKTMILIIFLLAACGPGPAPTPVPDALFVDPGTDLLQCREEKRIVAAPQGGWQHIAIGERPVHEPERLGAGHERLELDLRVADGARDRRTSPEVVEHERFDHGLREPFRQVEDVVRDAEAFGAAPRAPRAKRPRSTRGTRTRRLAAWMQPRSPATGAAGN